MHNILEMAEDDRPSGAPLYLAVKLLTRMVHVFRQHVSHQDVCQLVKIDESRAIVADIQSIAFRCSLVIEGVNINALQFQTQAWTECFNCFQNEVRVQLLLRGYRTAFYSFSLFPLG